MAEERQDYSKDECLRADNVSYCKLYSDYLTPHIYGKVLDIGCGTGWFPAAYAEKPDISSVRGTDLWPHQTPHPKVTYLHLSTEDLLKTDDHYDTIVSTEHIEHLPESLHRPLLAWIKQHCTQFVGSMPNVSSPSGNPFHLKEYSAAEWESLLKEYFTTRVETLPQSLQVWVCQS